MGISDPRMRIKKLPWVAVSINFVRPAEEQTITFPKKIFFTKVQIIQKLFELIAILLICLLEYFLHNTVLVKEVAKNASGLILIVVNCTAWCLLSWWTGKGNGHSHRSYYRCYNRVSTDFRRTNFLTTP